jgi:hypothetical protein
MCAVLLRANGVFLLVFHGWVQTQQERGIPRLRAHPLPLHMVSNLQLDSSPAKLDCVSGCAVPCSALRDPINLGVGLGAD